MTRYSAVILDSTRHIFIFYFLNVFIRISSYWKYYWGYEDVVPLYTNIDINDIIITIYYYHYIIIILILIINDSNYLIYFKVPFTFWDHQLLLLRPMQSPHIHSHRPTRPLHPGGEPAGQLHLQRGCLVLQPPAWPGPWLLWPREPSYRCSATSHGRNREGFKQSSFNVI